MKIHGNRGQGNSDNAGKKTADSGYDSGARDDDEGLAPCFFGVLDDQLTTLALLLNTRGGRAKGPTEDWASRRDGSQCNGCWISDGRDELSLACRS